MKVMTRKGKKCKSFDRRWEGEQIVNENKPLTKHIFVVGMVVMVVNQQLVHDRLFLDLLLVASSRRIQLVLMSCNHALKLR